ncbi:MULTISPECIES: hypothetical protein [unclassified Halomonas]|uniref:hypothetical protein n=1 Tax=unclassified Halomonas TaxID=2609666 RepID=UPI002076A68D|nr:MULTISPECIES: hypothetical protein [unclassified Halomonas]
MSTFKLKILAIIIFSFASYACFSALLPQSSSSIELTSEATYEEPSHHNDLIGRIESLEEVIGSILITSDYHVREKMSYSDWAAITLACVAILVTILGVLIALLSVWGYRNIAREAKTSAENVSNTISSAIAQQQVENCINDIAKEELIKLIDSGDLQKHLEDAVDLIYRNYALTGGSNNGFSKYPEIDEEGKAE